MNTHQTPIQSWTKAIDRWRICLRSLTCFMCAVKK